MSFRGLVEVPSSSFNLPYLVTGELPKSSKPAQLAALLESLFVAHCGSIEENSVTKISHIGIFNSGISGFVLELCKHTDA